MDDVLIHLVMSEPRAQAEVDRLFELDETLDDAFPDAYDGNEIGLGEFVIHLRHTDGDALLASIRPRLPQDLVRPGSHVVIRRTENDELTERVVPLAGVPRVAETREAVRKSIQASAIIKGATQANAATVAVVHRVRNLAREAAERHPAEFGVEYLLIVGGDVSRLEFEGVRTGSFRRAARQKQIQIGVPEILGIAPEEFLAARLEEALAVAEQYFRRKHKGVSLKAARLATMEVVDQLRARPGAEQFSKG